MAAEMDERDDDRRQARAHHDDDPAEQGTRGERDMPPNANPERPREDERQSER